MNPAGRRILHTPDARFALSRTEGKPATLSGYALVWNVPSSDRGGYRVKLLPGSARFATPTMALFHHDFRLVIGNTENGSLRITSDDYGAKVEIDLPDTSTGRDVLELVGKKYIRGMSFAMASSPKGKVIQEGAEEIFVAESYDVDEVTVTGIPAFNEAAIGVKPVTQHSTQHVVRSAQALLLERYRLDQIRL